MRESANLCDNNLLLIVITYKGRSSCSARKRLNEQSTHCFRLQNHHDLHCSVFNISRRAFSARARTVVTKMLRSMTKVVRDRCQYLNRKINGFCGKQ